MYEVGVVDHFEAAHSLKGDFGPASRKHGHTYRVELTVRGAQLRSDGTLCDMGQLSQALQRVVAELQFRDLDEVAAFQGKNTTAEVVAQHVFAEMRTRIQNRASLASMGVRVWESPGAFAAIDGSLGGPDGE